jgi:hypothetical protein
MPLPDEEARALWTKFSEHMDANKGDMAGFARLCGYASVRPEAQKGRAVLVVQTKEGAGAPRAIDPGPGRQERAGGSRAERSGMEPRGAGGARGGGKPRPRRGKP